MSRNGFRRRGLRVGVLAAAILALTAGVAVATTLVSNAYTDANGAYHGCVNPSNGNLRVVQPGEACKDMEVAIDWNRAGQQGAQGIQGPKGDTGAQGPKGDKGDTGPTGPQGDTGAPGPQGLKGDTGAPGPQGPKGDTGATGATGPQGPPGPAGSAVPPTVTSFDASTGFTGIGDLNWHPMPGVAMAVTLSTAGPVQLVWGFSTPVGGGYVMTRIVVDGIPVPETTQIITGQYGSSTAITLRSLNSGTHTVAVQYRASTSFTFNPVNFDWEAASLQALVFDNN